ncbi:MAG: PTS mannitol transporter subunit IICBA [Austwickia sp.]|nr:PTS mannitol transporter subunit IICBA [Actinomycetota bacterium]MCO5309271.1 PTS mannitol transporter subunit IICBA [Austwickia sp.]
MAPSDVQRPSARVRVQKFGTFLSSMIMPNIGAIIAWGFITALFIPDGPFPNAQIASIVGPSIYFLLPILIAYAGGKIIHDVRGGVVGAFAVMGVILPTSGTLAASAVDKAGNSIFTWANGHEAPMFLGAMILGPLTAWVMKKFDQSVHGRVKPGFEMLVDNFAAGIIAAVMAIVGMFALAPVVLAIVGALGSAVQFLVDHSLLPLTSLFIEPAKVFFLNNAINHGVLTPLGIQQAQEQGKSVLFLLEANPGPGLGILLAYMVFGKGTARASAPGAALVHFFGGIHEIYFPYVLMKPKLLLATIAGGMAGVFTNVLFHTGLRAPAAPGSIIAVLLQTATDSYIGVIMSVAVATGVTFAIAAFLLKTDRSGDEGDLAAATSSMESMKGKKSLASATLAPAAVAVHAGPIRQIVFACDAGMGSSAMGASVLRRKIQAAGHPEVTVVNKSIANLTDTFDLVVTHQDLTERARQRTESAVHVSVDNFMNSPRYDEIVDLLSRTNTGATGDAASTAGAAASTAGVASAAEPSGTPSAGGHAATGQQPGVLGREGIRLAGTAADRDSAITEAGDLLVAQGAVDATYVAAMHEREQSVSTYMGNLLAIPHGTNEAKGSIRRTAMSFVRYATPVDWNGNPVSFVVGIAGAGDDHLTLLSKLATVFLDNDQVARLEAATSPEEIQEILAAVEA